MAMIMYLDSVLVPLSLFLMLGYHANLWVNFRSRSSRISIGIDALRRKEWFLDMKEGDDKKEMLAVQSLRNTLMGTILTSTVAILVDLAVAALANNSYSASHHFHSAFLEPQSGSGGRIFALKYGLTSCFLLVSFFCSSVALGFLIDANFLINAAGESWSRVYTQTIFEKGFMLSLIGNRILCMSFPLLAWMLGPLPVALSSVALVWGLYARDFAGKFTRSEAKISLER